MTPIDYIPIALRRQVLSELARKGGKVKSAAKTRAARINGAKGGRPPKKRKV